MRTKVIMACITFVVALGLFAARSSLEGARAELREAQRDRDATWGYHVYAERLLHMVTLYLEFGQPEEVVNAALLNARTGLALATDQPLSSVSSREDVLAADEMARRKIAALDKSFPLLERRVDRLVQCDAALFIATLTMGFVSAVVAARKDPTAP